MALSNQRYVGPTEAPWWPTDPRAHPLVDRAPVQHPNPGHTVQPMTLPWNRNGRIAAPARTLPARTLTLPSGARR